MIGGGSALREGVQGRMGMTKDSRESKCFATFVAGASKAKAQTVQATHLSGFLTGRIAHQGQQLP